MADYTTIGIDKIKLQAASSRGLIRCPRDGAVMRVTDCRAEAAAGPPGESRALRALPRDPAWRVTELAVECPACRRQAAVTVPRQEY
ncbi:MAG: hypothetical protein ACE5PT_10645 [Gemmatimonadales bacterium]